MSSNNTTDFCPLSLRWSQEDIDGQRRILCICIVAAIAHSIFWLPFICCSLVRQRSLQWIYAYLITDIFLLCRYFFAFIVHATSTECTPNPSWSLFICYFEAAVDNYLNLIEVYVLLALNVCRYLQIAYNRNVYTNNVRLLIVIHLAIWLLPFASFLIQFAIGWAQLDTTVRGACDVRFMNAYAQAINIFFGLVLPIGLNISVVYASVRYVRLTTGLRRLQHHVTARERYHRSLVIQFLVFYTVWISLWSPSVIVFQVTSGTNDAITVSRLLTYIGIMVDPIIVGALDVRFWNAWRQIFGYLKANYRKGIHRRPRQVQPIRTDGSVQTIHNPAATIS